MVLKPTPTRFPINPLYTPMDNTPLHSITSVGEAIDSARAGTSVRSLSAINSPDYRFFSTRVKLTKFAPFFSGPKNARSRHHERPFSDGGAEPDTGLLLAHPREHDVQTGAHFGRPRGRPTTHSTGVPTG